MFKVDVHRPPPTNEVGAHRYMCATRSWQESTMENRAWSVRVELTEGLHNVSVKMSISEVELFITSGRDLNSKRFQKDGPPNKESDRSIELL